MENDIKQQDYNEEELKNTVRFRGRLVKIKFEKVMLIINKIIENDEIIYKLLYDKKIFEN